MVLITYTTCFDRFNLFFRDPTQKLLYISTSLWPKLVLKSSAIASSSIVMAQVVVLMAGLLLIAESQASDLADRSTHQGFLSKSDYDKFIAPNLNRMKHGNELGTSPFTVVDDKPILQSSAQVQNSSDPI